MQPYSECPQVLRDFLSYHESIKGQSRRTVSEYHLDLRMFLRFLTLMRKELPYQTPLDEIDIKWIDASVLDTVSSSEVFDFLSYLTNDRQNREGPADVGIAAAARARKLSAIKAFYKYLTISTKQIQNSGKMSAKKRVAAPGVSLGLPPISEQDAKDIIFGCEQDLDFVAASFIQRPEDVLAIRKLIEEHNGHMEIMPKIENLEGVKNFDAILEVSDGIMVARGDLGVEVPAEDVPLIQKEIIRKCNKAGKPVIVATQMLDSMERNPRPTRAEVSDVGNAILDGTDAIMLSGETDSGDYPVEAVSTMNRIACRIEESLEYKNLFVERGFQHSQSRTRAVAHATVQMAYELDVPAIITPTDSGYTTKIVSRYRPKAAIVAYTPHEKVVRQLNLRWGVYPILGTQWKDVDEMIANAVSAAVKDGFVKRGDTTIITSGIKLQSKTSVGNNTNMIRVYKI